MSYIGVVLAGGLSSRMGQDKATLDWQGQNLLEHMQALLYQGGCEQVLLSGLSEFPDLTANAGPLAGIARLLDECRGQRVLFVPVDMPLLKPKDLALLLSLDAATYFNHSYLPLAVTASEQVLLDVQLCLQAEQRRGRSIRAWLELIGAQSIELSDDTSLFNANTPEQWQELKRLACKA